MTDAESPGPLPDAVEETASECLEAAFRVHSDLGSGLLEKVYRDALAVDLRHRGLDVGTEVTVPISYRDQALGVGLRLDILVAGCVVIEVKSVDAFASAHTAQTLTYLEATGKRLGLLLNFGEPHLRNGIKRLIL
jgi:GxxExxY protein